MLPTRTRLLLCNYDESDQQQECETDTDLWSGNYAKLIKNSSILPSILTSDLTSTSINDYLNNFEDKIDEALLVGVSSLLYFCNSNWSSKIKEERIVDIVGSEWPERINASVRLQRDSEEVDSNSKYPELLLLASEIMTALCSIEESLLHLWWYLRCLVIHQRVLDDTSPSLYTQIELVSAKLSNLTQTLHAAPRLQVLLLAEISQAFLVYGRVQNAEEYLDKAMNVAGLKLQLKGILGKRTKHQQDNVAQLALVSSLDPDVPRRSAEQTHGAVRPLAAVALQDDVRLDHIAYTEDAFKSVELPSLEQTLCLLSVQYLQKSQPKDNLAEEELQPYIDTVIRQKHGPWSVRIAALLLKCRIESSNKRTVERAMMQCEAIANEAAAQTTSPIQRLSYLWASGLSPYWSWRQQLADLYLSLGLVKAALEEYLALQLWEDVIICYTLLQLRHKAAEIIQQQIDAKPTPKLYCLLGDATDVVSCYETAWQLSVCRSSRAQRHWGDFLFDRKKYAECIPHYEKSLEINSIQERVWLRLGYAALSTEAWEAAACAYRRYTVLQPSSFEAWNNLAKVYAKQGDKSRAYRALMEALKYNYDNWKLWENVITVSLDTGHLEQVLAGVHRLLDITGKFQDLEVLSLLARAVLEDHPDVDGNSSARLQKRLLELMGRVTSVHPTNPQLWQLYAELSPSELQRAQRLQKAYRGFTQEMEWSSDPETCKKVIDFAHKLLDSSLKAKKEVDEQQSIQAAQQLSSARLTAQSVIRAAERQNWPDVEPSLITLKEKLNEVMAFLKPLCV